jgi:predicted Zn-dependent protease
MVFQFTGVSLRSAWSTYGPAMTATMAGFREETDPAVLTKQPDRVVLARVEAEQSFSALVAGMPLPKGLDVLSLAILNQVDPAEQLGEGRTYKLIR